MAALEDEEAKECLNFASTCLAGYVLTLLLISVIPICFCELRQHLCSSLRTSTDVTFSNLFSS
jgi:hypothetical protein